MSQIIESIKKVPENIGILKEAFETKIERLGKLFDVVKGRQDSQIRANVILNPKNPSTTTNLTPNQVDFVTISKSICVYYPEFEGLEKFCDEFLQASISKEGWGVDRMIAYEQAIGEKRLMQIGIRPQGQNEGRDKPKSEKE